MTGSAEVALALRVESSGTPVAIRQRLFGTPRWYACRTRSRAEKQVSRLLASQGVESYLPLIEQLRQWADRRKRVAFPLFSGYVFARFDLRAMLDVLSTPGVVSIVRVNGYPTPLRDEEIESVRVLVAGVNVGDAVPEPVDCPAVGHEVVVTEGPFSGMQGVLVEQRGRSRVTVRISALRQAVSVELPQDILRPASPQRVRRLSG